MKRTAVDSAVGLFFLIKKLKKEYFNLVGSWRQYALHPSPPLMAVLMCTVRYARLINVYNLNLILLLKVSTFELLSELLICFIQNHIFL